MSSLDMSRHQGIPSIMSLPGLSCHFRIGQMQSRPLGSVPSKPRTQTTLKIMQTKPKRRGHHVCWIRQGRLLIQMSKSAVTDFQNKEIISIFFSRHYIIPALRHSLFEKYNTIFRPQICKNFQSLKQTHKKTGCHTPSLQAISSWDCISEVIALTIIYVKVKSNKYPKHRNNGKCGIRPRTEFNSRRSSKIF